MIYARRIIFIEEPMKLFRITMLVPLIMLLSCRQAPKQEKPLLLASIHPYELLLKQIAGSEFEVKSIIPPAASPHSWSPAPSDLQNLARASFILTNGLGLETSLEQNLKASKTPIAEAATLLKDIIPILPTNHEDHAHEAEPGHLEAVHSHAQDPHLWTSPQLMSRLAAMLAKELSVHFPNSALLFNRNAQQITKEMNALSEAIKSERSSYSEPAIITYHNSFGYFCLESGVQNLGWVQASPGKEPSPRELALLGDLIKSHKIRAIFLEPQMDRKAGEVLAREFGLQLFVLDPLGSHSKAGTLSQLMTENWNSMKKSFNPR